jgi:hypothetical protein
MTDEQAQYAKQAKELVCVPHSGDDPFSFDPLPEVDTVETGAYVACWIFIPKEDLIVE